MNNLALRLLRKPQSTAGFSLLELIVVVVIIGILAAIALPALLNQTNRARQVEGISNVGALNRAQQAFYLQNGRFATSLAELNAGVPAETNNYEFSSVGVNTGIGSRAVSTASLLDGSTLQGFAGVVQVLVGDNGEAQSVQVICASQPGVEPIAPAGNIDPADPNVCGANQTRQ